MDNGEKLQLLVVEDDEDDFVLIRHMLRPMRDVEVARAASVDDALARSRGNPYDLFLCDYRLGEKTGLELLDELKDRDIAAPVIFLTGQGDEEVAVQAMKAGATDYLLKSKLTEQALGRAVAYAVALHRKEQAIEAARQELRRSEQEYRALFRNINDAIVIFEPNSEIILEVNPKACEIYGFTREELIGMSLKRLTEDVPQGERQIAELLRWGSYRNFETVHFSKDGSRLQLLANSSVINYRGKPAVLSIHRDITERKQLQEQLLQAQKMDAVGQLAGGVAHDFNNLLLVISSYAELLADSLPQDDKLRRDAEEILKAARRAAALTRQLLAFSRKQVLSPRVLDLNAVLGETEHILPRLIGEHIEVKLVPGASLWNVHADPMQIEQVVLNLAVNARDAMPQGGVLTLETSNVHLEEDYVRHHAGIAPGDYVLLAVSDTGAGIPPDVLPHIFEPFFTTKEPGKGTGLGLPTVYGIVQQSGGFIWVYSEPGEGTVFKIYLPRCQRAVEETVAPPAPAEPLRGSETILLVEDEEAVREAASEFLSLQGYTVLQARNGSEALEIARRFADAIQLVITDVVMPGMGGRELADRLRQSRPTTRVLFVSGYTEGAVQQRGVEPDGGFLPKPFSLSVLGRKVRELIESPVETSAAR
jgi:two-component system cell cycle sensor histidine kinase/response regulator CckA